MFQIPPMPSRSARRLSSTFCIAAAFCALAFGCISCGTSGTSDEKLATALGQDLNDYLTSRASIEHISTLSLTVSFRGGAPDINVATGTTQYGAGAAVTPANVFQTGSNTKAFTAVRILQLEAAGLLSINDSVAKWLPQYPQYSAVTIKQLLNMTSGIPSYSNDEAFEQYMADNTKGEPTPEEIISYVSSQPVKTPGAAFDYSNTNYILAQMIIDKVSPTGSYQTDIDNIISQNNLQDTFYQPYFYPSSVTSRLVSGYYVNTDDQNTPLKTLLGQDTSGFSLGWAQGAGGMISTPEDLTKWVRDLFEGNVLQPTQLQEIKSLVSTHSGQPITQTSAEDPGGFGLGIFQFTDPSLGGLFWAYEGSTIGYRASYAYYPDSGLIVCVFTNSQTSSANNQMTKSLFPKLLATLKAAGRI
jgi:D-alanyl-D-alanine carboxypeptidase